MIRSSAARRARLTQSICGALLVVCLAGSVLATALAFGGNSPVSRYFAVRSMGAKPARLHDVVFQQNGYDCGPAAVANVLRLRGLRIGLSRIERVLHPTFEGTGIFAMAATLRRYGVAAHAVRTSAPALETMALPIIVLGKHHYYVVGQRLGGRTFEVLDPAAGDLVMSYDSIAARWGGWVIATH